MTTVVGFFTDMIGKWSLSSDSDPLFSSHRPICLRCCCFPTLIFPLARFFSFFGVGGGGFFFIATPDSLSTIPLFSVNVCALCDFILEWICLYVFKSLLPVRRYKVSEGPGCLGCSAALMMDGSSSWFSAGSSVNLRAWLLNVVRQVRPYPPVRLNRVRHVPHTRISFI